MRLPRSLIPGLLLVATWLTLPARARAETALTVGQPDWQGRPETALPTDQINRADCLAGTNMEGASINFHVTGVPNEGVYELWAGAGCNVSTNRTGDDATCVKVSDADAGDDVVNARVQDLVKNYQAGLNDAAGTAATCDDPSDEGENKRVLWFVVYDTNTPTVSTASGQWAFSFDTVAPPPPTNVKAGSGENSLTVDLTAPDGESNLSHYRFYCAPNEAGDGACSAAALVPGMPPDETYNCGSVNATAVDSGTSNSNLTNGSSYALALAAQDSYSNVGVLSEVSCAIPQEVTGFYEAYRAAGGEAGGGFCTYAPARRGTGGIALAFLCGAAALLRRRK